MKKILFISEVGPSNDFTGGQVLVSISEYLSKYFQIDWLILHQRHHASYEVAKFNSSTKFTWLFKPIENWSSKINLLGINILGEKYSNKDCQQIFSHLRRKISREMPDQIILVLQGQTSFKIGNFLLSESLSFSTISWDPWIWWARENNVPKYFNNEVKKLYESFTFGKHLVPTSEFAARYGIAKENSVVLYPFVKQASTLDGANGLVDANPSVINLVYAGQIYATEEFNKLLGNLDTLGWEIQGKKILLHYLGKLNPPSRPNVVVHGFVDPKDLIACLAKFDAAVLVYPHEREIPEVAKLSFPSKYATYCAAGLPTLYLGPTGTPVSKMITADMGIAFDYETLNLSEVLQFLVTPNEVIAKNIRDRYDNCFSDKAFQKSLDFAFEVPASPTVNNVEYQNLDLMSFAQIDMSRKSDLFNAITSPYIISRWILIYLKIPRRRVATLYFAARMMFMNFVSGNLR
jgi:hypothetical protein